MKCFSYCVFICLIFVSCAKSTGRGEKGIDDSGKELTHIDSVAIMHNYVLDRLQLKTKIDEPPVNPPIPIFIHDIKETVEEILKEMDIDYIVDEEQITAAVNLVRPLISGILFDNIGIDQKIKETIDETFSEECADYMNQLIESDFDQELSLDEFDGDEREAVNAFYTIGTVSRNYWTRVIPNGVINKSSYAADALGGALSIVCGFSGIAGWFMLIVSTSWSAAVDSYDPKAPIDWTNCD